MDCLLLHSTECITLLEGAYQKLEREEKVEEEQPLARALATFEFFADGDDSSSDDGKQQESDEEGGSSSSSEDGSVNDKEKESLPTVSETITSSSPPLVSTAPSSLENTNNSQPSKTSRKDPKQRQREQDVKRHAQKLQRTSFSYEDKSDMAIHVPTSLLPSRQSKSKQCCHILQVAKSLAALKPVVVLLLRSGRFAAAVYQQEKCLHHTTSTRYTVRKGQGKAQSSQDGQRRPKSMGSQLRRAGEQQLKEDVHSTLRQWKSHIDQSALILISCPKTMRSTLFENMEGGGLDKADPRLVSIPFDVGRPSFEGAGIVYEALMTVSIGSCVEKEAESESRSVAEGKEMQPKTPTDTAPIALQAKKEPDIIPLTKLHEASRDANLTMLLDLLRDPVTNSVDQPAGYDFMTPLHFASESTADPTMAAACISALLIQGHANPRMVDARNRVPYFLAHHDKAREAFRKARAVLGEESCDWDAAQVGPPLTEDDIQAKKEKEAEKKRRKKQKQKEKKTKEKAQAEEMQQRRKKVEEEENKAEDAKRVRDALEPKAVRKDNVCDFCQTEVKGRKRQQMFKRLDYNYCSSECVQKHKRELMAKAAMERFK